jgi:hypothetical protein
MSSILLLALVGAAAGAGYVRLLRHTVDRLVGAPVPAAWIGAPPPAAYTLVLAITAMRLVSLTGLAAVLYLFGSGPVLAMLAGYWLARTVALSVCQARTGVRGC